MTAVQRETPRKVMENAENQAHYAIRSEATICVILLLKSNQNKFPKSKKNKNLLKISGFFFLVIAKKHL